MKENMSGTSFHIANAIASLPDGERPRVLGHYDLDGPAMLGVIRIGEKGTEGFWERHNGGDELLVILDGRCTMTLRPENGPDGVHELGPGDALLIPKGVAHSGKLHTPELRILFITPRDGNDSWTDRPDREGRHGSETPWPDVEPT